MMMMVSTDALWELVSDISLLHQSDDVTCEVSVCELRGPDVFLTFTTAPNLVKIWTQLEALVEPLEPV